MLLRREFRMRIIARLMLLWPAICLLDVRRSAPLAALRGEVRAAAATTRPAAAARPTATAAAECERRAALLRRYKVRSPASTATRAAAAPDTARRKTRGPFMPC